jgi:hypothetical protein
MRCFRVSCWLTTCVGLLLAASAGCHTMDKSDIRWPWKKKPEVGPHVTTAKERMEKMREMAKNAPTLPPAEQERESFEFTQMLRNREDDGLIRAEILRTLAKYPTATATAALEAGMRDGERDVRVACCQAWGLRGGPDAVRKLSEAIANDADIDVRLAAARELGKLRDPGAVAALGAALDSTDPAMQHRAVESLREVTGKDFGDNVNTWRDFVRGGNPPEESFVSRWIPRF